MGAWCVVRDRRDVLRAVHDATNVIDWSMRACMGGQAHTQKGHTTGTCVGRDCFQATFAVCAVCSLAAGALCVVLWWFIRRREAAASSRKHSQDDGSRDAMY